MATETSPASAGASSDDVGDVGVGTPGVADPAFDAGSGGDGGESGGTGGVDVGAQAAPVAKPFGFAQRQWPNQGAAEREFLTTIGRLQAAQRRQAELEQLVESYKGIREAQAPEGADQGESGAGVDADGEEPFVDIDSLDWQLISKAMMDPQQGPAVGMYLFAQALLPAIGQAMQSRMEAALTPLNTLREHATTSAQTARLWDGAMNATDQQGNMIFPELSDPGSAQVVFDLWRTITEGMPPEVANSPRMARTAVLEYRAMKALQASSGNGGGEAVGGAGEPAVNPGAVAEGVVGAMRRAAQGQGVLPAGPGGKPAVPARRGKPMTEEEQIKASLLSEGQERSSLGFRR